MHFRSFHHTSLKPNASQRSCNIKFFFSIILPLQLLVYPIFNSLPKKNERKKMRQWSSKVYTQNTLKSSKHPSISLLYIHAEFSSSIYLKTYFSLMFYSIMISSLIVKQFLVVNGRGYKQNIAIINNNKRMFYQFSFDTQANFDEADLSFPHTDKHHSLPTTTHNSPGSNKSYSLLLDEDHSLSSECSFEANTQTTHASSIWTSSIDLLKSSIFGAVDEERGMNALAKGDSSNADGLEEAIKANKLLRSRERSKFLLELQRESELCGLLTELMILFSAPLFQEVLYVVHNLWDRHYLPFRLRSNSCSFLPKFSAFMGWESEEKQVEGMTQTATDSAQVKREAQQGLEQLARELFYSKKLKLLNMADVKTARRDKRALEDNFLAFLKAVSKSVFLSAEGFYEEEALAGIFSEEEEMDCEGFELEGNRFVRAFSQIQAEHESLNQSSKRRKLE